MAKSRIIQKDIDINSMTMPQLKMYISQAGKRVNQRIVETKEMSNTSFQQNILNLEFKGMWYIGRSKSGNLKYKLNTRGKSIQELRQLAKAINTAEKTTSSTKEGIKKSLNKSYETFKENTGLDLSLNAYIGIWKNENMSEFKKMYGSNEVVNIIKGYSSKYKAIQRRTNTLIRDAVQNKMTLKMIWSEASYNPFENGE